MYQDLTGTGRKIKGGCGYMTQKIFCRSGKENSEFSLSGYNFLTKEKEVSYEAAVDVQERKMKAAMTAREAARRCLTAGRL